MYKSLSLAALLLPFSGYGANKNQARINELTEAQYKKSVEIQDLVKRISDADEYIRSCVSQYHSLVDVIVQKKKQVNVSARIEEQKIRQEIEQSLQCLLDSLEKIFLGKRAFDLDLLNELFDQNDLAAVDSFKSLSFMCMRGATERTILTSLVLRYQKCLQELLNINQELNNL